MSSAWKDISDAPKGDWTTEIVQHPKGDRERKVFVPEYIFAYRVGNDRAYVTRWVPEVTKWGRTTGGYWEFFGENNPPTHWCPVPEIDIQ